MVKDRLNDLIKARKNENGDIELEMPEEREPLTGTNIRQTFERAEIVRQWIESIEQNIETIRQYVKKLDDLKINQRELNDKIDDLFGRNISISAQIQPKLKLFDEELQEMNSLSAEDRIKRIQYNTLKTRYQKAFKQNSSELEHYKNIKKSQLKAQIRAKGISVTEEQLLKLMEDKTDVNIFTENILAETADAKRALQDIEERHQQLVKIENMIEEVRDLFLHMAILIENQQELIDRVEYQAEIAQNFVERGRDDLKKGETNRKKALKKKIILFVILLIVIAVILILLII